MFFKCEQNGPAFQNGRDLYRMPSIYAIYAAPCMLPYYGSRTMTPAKRRGNHKCTYRRWKEGRGRYCSSFDLFDAVGFDACIFEVVEELPDDCSKEQRRMRERWWIENNVCVNRQIPIRTDDERIEYQRRYDDEHQVKIAEYQRQYRIEHQAEKAEYNRQWRSNHKVKISEQRRIRRVQKKAEAAEAAKNGCGEP